MSGMDCQALPPDVLAQVLEGPGMTPPDHVVPNFENPPNDNATSYAVTGVCLALSTMFVYGRAHAVWLVMKKPSIMDYIMLIAYGLLVAYCCVTLVVVDYWGTFIHQYHFKFRDLPGLLQIMLVKTNILMEWLRIFSPRGSRDYIFWGSHALSGINILWHVAAVFILNFTCRPHAKNWDCRVRGSCFDSQNIYIFSAALGLFINVVILLLPQKVIWGLELNVRKKLGIASMFAVGIIGIVAAAFRVETTVRYTQTHDITFVTSQLTLWTLAESTSGLIVFCMPVLPKLSQAVKETRLVSSVSLWVSKSMGVNKGSASDGFSELWDQPRPVEKPREPVESLNLPIQQFSTSEEDLEYMAASVTAGELSTRRREY